MAGELITNSWSSQGRNTSPYVLCERFSPQSMDELNDTLPMYGVEDLR